MGSSLGKGHIDDSRTPGLRAHTRGSWLQHSGKNHVKYGSATCGPALQVYTVLKPKACTEEPLSGPSTCII